MKLIPTRYFFRKNLEPASVPTAQALPILPDKILERIKSLAIELRDKSYAELPMQYLDEHPDIAVFMGVIHSIGAARVVNKDEKLRLQVTGPLGGDVAYALFLMLQYGFPIFDDWTRRHKLPDSLSALEFLHHLELQRIEYSKRSGIHPEILHEIPVAFAVIKGYSRKRRKDMYLLELNKDWDRYNLIGGKQQPQDGMDHRHTLLREIEEELGIQRNDVQLTLLTEKPLEGYSLSGYRGVLAHYPCMLFLAHFRTSIPVRAKDRWLTEEEIRQLRSSESPGLMINPTYLNFLFEELPGGLKGLEYSVKTPVDEQTRFQRVTAFIVLHKEWVVAVLLIIAAIIALIKVVLGL